MSNMYVQIHDETESCSAALEGLNHDHGMTGPPTRVSAASRNWVTRRRQKKGYPS